MGDHFCRGTKTRVIIWTLHKDDMDVIRRVPGNIAIDGFAAANVRIVRVLNERHVLYIRAFAMRFKDAAIRQIREIDYIRNVLLLLHQVFVGDSLSRAFRGAQIILSLALRLFGSACTAAAQWAERVNIGISTAVERK
jgi:hypothetical protein